MSSLVAVTLGLAVLIGEQALGRPGWLDSPMRH